MILKPEGMLKRCLLGTLEIINCRASVTGTMEDLKAVVKVSGLWGVELCHLHHMTRAIRILLNRVITGRYSCYMCGMGLKAWHCGLLVRYIEPLARYRAISWVHRFHTGLWVGYIGDK